MEKLLPSDGAQDDNFGTVVAISPSDVLVSSPYDDTMGTDSGSVYIFDLAGVQQNKITAVDGVSGDNFGLSIATSGTTIVVGSPNADGTSGAAYIFTSSGILQHRITAGEDTASGNIFGCSVSVSGSNVVVGARGVSLRGAAYIFSTAGVQLAKILAPDASEGDNFGFRVAVSESNIVVTDIRDDDKGQDSGSVYSYDTAGNFERKIVAFDGGTNDLFGFSISLDGSTVVVGSLNDDESGSDGRAAYIYSL